MLPKQPKTQVSNTQRQDITINAPRDHNLRQENAHANNSLISVLAIATVAMLGITLAAYFGAFEVSSAGLIGCYVGTGVAGLALIAAIASRCIGGSKLPDGSESEVSSHDGSESEVPIPDARICDIRHNADGTTATIVTEEEESREVVVPFVEGKLLEYDFAPNTYCLMCTDGTTYFHVFGPTEDKGIRMWFTTSPEALENLFSDPKLSFPLPQRKADRVGAAAAASGDIAGVMAHDHLRIVDTVIDSDRNTATFTLSSGEKFTLEYTEENREAYDYYYLYHAQCLVLENGHFFHLIGAGKDEEIKEYPVAESPYLERLFSEPLTAPSIVEKPEDGEA